MGMWYWKKERVRRWTSILIKQLRRVFKFTLCIRGLEKPRADRDSQEHRTGSTFSMETRQSGWKDLRKIIILTGRLRSGQDRPDDLVGLDEIIAIQEVDVDVE